MAKHSIVEGGVVMIFDDFKRWNKKFKAFFHLNQSVICELSTDENNYHDYTDATEPDNKSPMHFYEYTCRHCGKKFYI